MQFENEPFNGDTFLSDLIFQISIKYRVKKIIETGTYHGISTLWMSKFFTQVHSIEIDPDNFIIASANLKNHFNVQLYLGQSQTFLRVAIKNLNPLSNENFIIFLDAHWFENPLLKELDAIKESGYKPIIIIHDFQTNDPELGFDSYPDIEYKWESIKEKIESIGQYYKFYNKQATGARRGCIFLVPK